MTELIRAAVTIAGVSIGGYISWRVAATNLQRMADRAEKTDRDKQKRDALIARLAMQRATYQEFLELFAKHQAAGSEALLGGVMANFQRDKEEATAAHNDAVALYGKIALAFGSAEFAGQASIVLEMISAVRRRPLERALAEQFATRCAAQMRDAIAGTEKQLELPAFSVVPKPLIPHNEFNDMIKRAHLHDLADQVGFDKAKIDELLEAARKAREAKEPKS